MNYDRLYFDKRMKWGAKFGFALGKNREVNYNTIDNKEVFLKDTNNFIRSFFRTNLELTYRRAVKQGIALVSLTLKKKLRIPL
jgi:hypothetical protein